MLRRHKQQQPQPPQTTIVSSQHEQQQEKQNGLSSSSSHKKKSSSSSTLFRTMIIIVSFWIFIILGFTILVPRFKQQLRLRRDYDETILTTSNHRVVVESDSNIIQQSQQQRQGQGHQKEQPPASESANTNTDSNSDPEFHLVFSTGCSLYQDWQSYVFFYHVYKVSQRQQQQMGNNKSKNNNIKNVTRIVSGCNDKQQQVLQQTHYEQIQKQMSYNFLLHFTPDYSKIKGSNIPSYKYFNKPFGMKHWMEHKLGYNNTTSSSTSSSSTTTNPYDDVIIVLLDPDQLLLRPFTHDYTNIRMDWTRKGYNAPNSNVSKIITHGKTITQTYAFGDDYTALNLTHVLLHEEPNNGNNSPLWTMSKKQKLGYAAGPPYLATAKDFYILANKWSELVPRVHDVYPYLLAEMYAYCIAAIQVNLRPMTASGFMVSNVDVQRGEGWYWIDQEKFDGNGKGLADKLNKPDYSDVCPPKQQQGQQQGQGQQLQRHQDTLPFVLHYCQRYGEELKGAYYFSKYEMRPKFLSCGVELLQEPTVDDIAGPQTDVSLVDSLIAKRNAKKNATDGGGSDSDTSGLSELKRLMFRPRNRHRDAWVLCTLIPAINEAAVFFKTRHCPTDPGSSTNFNKSRVFPEKVVNRHNWA